MSIVCGKGMIEVDEDRFIGMLADLKPHLDERQWRADAGGSGAGL